MNVTFPELIQRSFERDGSADHAPRNYLQPLGSLRALASSSSFIMPVQSMVDLGVDLGTVGKLSSSY